MFQPNASIYVMAGRRTPADGKRLGEQMSKKISGCLTQLAFLGLTVLLISCGTSSSRPAGVLYYLSQGDSKVGSYAINLNSGALSLINKTSTTDKTPSAILADPTGKVAYVLNTDPSSNSITTYTFNSEGSLSAPTSTTLLVQNAVAMALDPAGTFLAVVSQGSIPLPGTAHCPHPEPNSECPAITIFTTQSGSTTLTQAGDPFALDFVPTSLAVSITGAFNDPKGGSINGTLLHVTGNQDLTANNIDNTIGEFVVQSSGAIAGPLIGFPYLTATNPSSVVAVRTTPVGGAGGLFVYVSNDTDDNVSVYQVCTVADGTNCLDSSQDVQNAKMIPVGNPVSVGQEPVAMTVDPTKNFLYVVNHLSSTVSSFRINPTTGALSALSPSTVSTGLRPVAITMHSSGKFLYVSNNGSSNVSGFNADTTSGALSNATTVTSSAQPAGLAAK
jgi:6-phosphogluconolactonase (cycloisomerase 2 family)